MTKQRADLSGKDIIHGQNIDFRVDRKWSIDLGADHLGTIDLQQLVDLSARSDYTLESHVAGSPRCTNICLIVVDRKHTILDCISNEAVSLSVPKFIVRNYRS